MFQARLLQPRTLSSQAFLGRAFYTVIRSKPAVYFHQSPTSAPHWISLSPDPNALPIGYTNQSPNVGFIQAEQSEAADFSSNSEKATETIIPTPQKFKDNPEFTKILAKVGAESFPTSVLYNSLAEGESYREGTTLHVYDMRNPPPYGRIPEVQDIVGMVRIQAPDHSKKITAIIPDSFEYNPMYRPLAMTGFVNLGDEMNKKLRLACEKAGAAV